MGCLPTVTSTYNPYNFAISARVCLLGRSRDQIRSFTDAKTYSVCGYPTATPGDGFLRRVFDENVRLRNTIALRIFN